MRAVDIIARKRDGHELDAGEIGFLVQAYTAGEIADYQMSALLMAIYLRGMNSRETLALTEAMLHSGVVVDFSDLGRPRVDKHSTGGVGDKTSLVVAPVVAAAGVLVPMISGRALAHSGGTLDKLESIPGFRTDLSLKEFREALESTGVALIGQTAEIAPADKKLYALRDVTGTVACRPLMASSIMSKKMAEGVSGLVLDVKVGSGAFLKSESEARSLAETMIGIAKGLDKDAVALLTNMNQPLGNTIGNSLEVIEAVETLKESGPDDLNSLCRELSGEMLVLGRAATDLEAGRKRYDELISSGAALEKLRAIIRNQSGDPRIIDDYSRLPSAANQRQVQASASGIVGAIDAEAIGHASMLLGAGRLRIETPIDYGAGVKIHAKIGQNVEAGSSLATLYYNNADGIETAAELVSRCYTIGSERAPMQPLIRARIA
jgi:pyrimidine-nucleoside phosphorylase